MALINCPLCKNAISDDSRYCPHCRYVLRSETPLESAYDSLVPLLKFGAFWALWGGVLVLAIKSNDWILWSFLAVLTAVAIPDLVKDLRGLIQKK